MLDGRTASLRLIKADVSPARAVAELQLCIRVPDRARKRFRARRTGRADFDFALIHIKRCGGFSGPDADAACLAARQNLTGEVASRAWRAGDRTYGFVGESHTDSEEKNRSENQKAGYATLHKNSLPESSERTTFWWRGSSEIATRRLRRPLAVRLGHPNELLPQHIRRRLPAIDRKAAP